MAFQHCRNVGNEERDAIAAPNASLFEGAGQSADALIELGVCVAGISIDHGRFIGVRTGTPVQELTGTQAFK